MHHVTIVTKKSSQGSFQHGRIRLIMRLSYLELRFGFQFGLRFGLRFGLGLNWGYGFSKDMFVRRVDVAVICEW